MNFHCAEWHADGSKGTCDRSGELTIKNSDDECDNASFIRLPAEVRIEMEINRRLTCIGIRERDEMFLNSLGWLYYIRDKFENGYYKQLNMVQTTVDIKRIINGMKKLPEEYEFIKAWTYEVPYITDAERFIAITREGKMYFNAWVPDEDDVTWGEGKVLNFIYDAKEDIEKCVDVIKKIRENNMVTKTLIV